MRLGIVLFNLGGPDSPDAVEPFLRNLFSDPAIISLPWPLRLPLARLIAGRRAPVAREIYHQIGGASPIVAQTRKQAQALEAALADRGVTARAAIAMRCWHPFSDEAARELKAFAPDKVVMLPLYPQYSTTTSASSIKEWKRVAAKAGLPPASLVCCYPDEPGFIAATVARLEAVLAGCDPGLRYRVLLSAHGLPKRTIARGDPYQWQVERTAAALRAALPALDFQVCYQSRVGPMEWIGPATDAEIRRAGREGLGVIVAPIAFVSEHSETLVELDIEYAKLAREAGVPDYRRAATVGDHPDFIAGLAGLALKAASGHIVNAGTGRLCPAEFCRCGFGNE